MRLLKKTIILLSVLFLVACHKLEKGVIVEKYERSAYTTFVKSGKGMVPIHHPKSWNVKIKGDYKGKTRIETYSVSKDYFEKARVGDIFEVRDD